MARFANPLLDSAPGAASSGGFSVAPRLGVEPVGADLGRSIAGLAASLAYDPENDPRAQQAALYKAQTGALQDERTANFNMSDLIANLKDMDPATQATTVRNLLSAAARGGIDPKRVATAVQALVPNMGGTEDQIARAYAANGGAPHGIDQAFTVPRQDQLRSEDQSNKVALASDLAATTLKRDLAVQDKRNAGEMDRTRFTIRNEKVNTPAGTKTTFGPEAGRPDVEGAPNESQAIGQIIANLSDPNKVASVTPEAQALAEAKTGLVRNVNKDQRAKELLPKSASNGSVFDPVDDEIKQQIPGQTFPPDVVARIKSAATENYINGNGNLSDAVRQAIVGHLEPTGRRYTTGSWYNPASWVSELGTTDHGPQYQPRSAAPAGAKPADPLGIR